MPSGYALTHDEFVKRMHDINPNIEIVGRYTRRKDRVKCRCIIDGHEWNPFAGDLLDGSGCPKCKGRKRSQSSRKTHEQFLRELAAINPNIEVLTRYETANTDVHCRCKIDGNEWDAKPSQLLSGEGCRVCGYRTVSERLSLPYDEFLKRLHDVNPNVILLDKYQNMSSTIHCKCAICGYEWPSTGRRLVRGDGCSRCSGKEPVSHDDFVNRISEINPWIEIVGTYTGRHTKVKCRCRTCGYEWEPYPGNLYQGWGCSNCGMSRGERAIETYLCSHRYDHYYNTAIDGCKSQKSLLFDFVLPQHNMVIEYDGEQHFRPVKFGGMSDEKAQHNFEATRQRDSIKNQFCKDNHIKMIRIPYTEYDHIENILDKLLA